MIVVCAWCTPKRDLLALSAGPDPVSHTICPACLARELAKDGPKITDLPDLPEGAVGVTIQGSHYARAEYEALRRRSAAASGRPSLAWAWVLLFPLAFLVEAARRVWRACR